MPRPCKLRRICAVPACEHFGPKDSAAPAAPITMTLDEYETIRLIDLEKFTQADCAVQMKVARTTVQAIYDSARAKLAECLVNGRELQITGGDFFLCDGRSAGCRNNRCWRRAAAACTPQSKEVVCMKIAVPYENGQIFPHFGHSAQFKLYEVADGKVTASVVADTNGSGHGLLAGFLQSHGVDALICGGIGGGAQQALAQAGIRLFGGVSGAADDAVQALLEGRLAFDPDAHCTHSHGGEEGHACGDHGCGGHSCH